MIEKVTEYSIDQSEALRNMITEDSLIINHVVMDPGQSFPAHITEYEVHIIIISGHISIQIENQEPHEYSSGNMITLPKGIVSAMANHSGKKTEIFAIKNVR